MRRRDFLLCRTERSRPVVEVSCRRLYLHALECHVTGGSTRQVVDLEVDGEPPAVFETQPIGRLLEDVERAMSDASLLRIVDPSWIRLDELTRALDALIAAHRSRGGEVELVPESRA